MIYCDRRVRYVGEGSEVCMQVNGVVEGGIGVSGSS